MQSNLLTAGLFAKLARTTKRTVLWYDKRGLLQPAHIEENGYRYYEPRQIIDFQTILLLRNMRFSIEEIKDYLAQSASPNELLKLKEAAVQNEIVGLKKALASIKTSYRNLETNGTLSNPKIVTTEPFDIYYIVKTGPYAKIKDCCMELKAQFGEIPRTATYLTIFFGGYEPSKAKMKVGVVVQDSMRLKKAGEKLVQRESIPPFKALKHTHKGRGSLVSLLWQELEKYAQMHSLVQDHSLPFVDLEMYKKTSLNGENDEDNMIFELYLPIQ